MSGIQENDPLIPQERGSLNTRHRGTNRSSVHTESSIRYRTSVIQLTSMDADGLALDDGAGTYVHEDGGNTNRLSIIDDELQTRDDSIDINKTKRNHILGTALKIVLIVLTVCIYTGGPMLNSWATRIPGWQWNFSLVANTNAETETGIDLINYDQTFDGKRNFVHYAHKASNCEWISVEEYNEKTADGTEDKDVKNFRMSDLAKNVGTKRTWEAVVFPELGGRPYTFCVKGKGNYKISMTLFKDAAFTQQVTSATNNGVEFDFGTSTEEDGTVSTPVILPNLDEVNNGNIFVKFTFDYVKPADTDFMQIQWYFEDDIVSMSPADQTARLMDRSRTLDNFKADNGSINAIIHQKGKWAGKIWVDVFGDNPGGDPYNMMFVTMLYKCFSYALGMLGCIYLGFTRKEQNDGDIWHYVKACFNWRNILKFAPCSLMWVSGDFMEMMASSGLDPAVYIVLTQLRLVLTAIVALFMLGTRQNKLQWIMLACLTLSVMVFKLDGKGEGGWPMVPLLCTLGKVALSVIAGVYGEKMFKGIKQPFPVQLCNFTITAVPIAALYLPILAPAFDETNIFRYGPFGGPDFGFDYRTWVVIFFYVFREWVTNICVKRFSAVVKNICNAVAPLAAYVLQFAILQTKVFEIAKLFIILVVILEVTNYSFAKVYINKNKIGAEDLPIAQPKGPPGAPSPIAEGSNEDGSSSATIQGNAYPSYAEPVEPARRQKSPEYDTKLAR